MKNKSILYIILGVCGTLLIIFLILYGPSLFPDKSKWDVVDAQIIGTSSDIDSYTTISRVNYKIRFLYRHRTNYTTVKCNLSDFDCKQNVGKYIKVRVEPKLNTFDEYGNVEIVDERPFNKN